MEGENSTFPESSPMNGELGQYVMEQAIAKILYHTGFEGISTAGFLTQDFQSSALDVMTGVAVEYLQDIGRTLRLYMNSNDSRKRFSEEVSPLSPSLMAGNSYACFGFEWSPGSRKT